MKRKALSLLSLLWTAGHVTVAWAAPHLLALRYESGTSIHEAATAQTIETNFGTETLGLAFNATATYDFYSPPLAANVNLLAGDRGGGLVFMNNTGASATNDFTVTGRMQYYDYNMTTGTEVLVADTGASSPQDVVHGQVTSWSLHKFSLPANVTIRAGHLVHIAVIITLVSGNPAGLGQLLYNGPSGQTTTGIFWETSESPAQWNFSAPMTPTVKLTAIQVLPDKTVGLTCAGMPNQTYLLQATTDLAHPAWVTIATNTAGSDGYYWCVDASATNYPCRFYRTATPY